MISELPEGVRWVWVPSFSLRCYAHNNWVPTTDELEQAEQDYRTAMELCSRFPDRSEQHSYAAMLREKVMKEQDALIQEVLRYQVEHGFITFKQYRDWEYHCSEQPLETEPPTF